LSRVFRGKFVAGLKRAFRRKKLVFFGPCLPLAAEQTLHTFLRTLFREEWVVYAKQPFGGPEHVLHYLARYTHRVAISNHRLVDLTDTHVTFRWKDYAHGSKRRKVILAHEELLRRFLEHVLPRGLPRIRYFGFLANRRRALFLPLCRTLSTAKPTADASAAAEPAVWHCLRCQGVMKVVEFLSALQIFCEKLVRSQSMIRRKLRAKSNNQVCPMASPLDLRPHEPNHRFQHLNCTTVSSMPTPFNPETHASRHNRYFVWFNHAPHRHSKPIA